MYQFLSDFDRSFPFADFDRVFHHFDRVLGSVNRGPTRAYRSAEDFWFSEDEKGYTLHAELPGATESDVGVTVHEGVLNVQGKRKLVTPEGFQATRRERAELDFSRSFRLPDDVDPSSAEALLERGILTIKLTKSPKAQPRQIAVRAS